MVTSYRWKYDTQDNTHYLISIRSNYAVGKVFPSFTKPGFWCWSVEHVGFTLHAEGHEEDPEKAKEKALDWVIARASEWSASKGVSLA